MPKVFHVADIHFGVENYGKIDPQTGVHTRLLDFYNSLKTVVDRAIEEKIDLFVFAGDAYKTAHPTPTQQKLLMELFLKLQQAKIPAVIVVGNHDNPLSFGKAHALDVFSGLPLDGFYVFSKPGLVTIETRGGPVQVVGIPWPTRNNVVTREEHHYKRADEITKYLSERVGIIVAEYASQLDNKIPAILTGHLTVSSGIFSGSEKCAVYGTDPIFLPSQLALNGFDYVALGHLHRYQNLNPSGYPAVVYSGSTERVDFGERKEEKGFCKVNLVREKTTHEFITLKTRPFIQIEVEIGDGDQTTQIINEIKKRDISEAVIKILYHISADRSDRVDIVAIQRECENAMFLVGVIPVRVGEISRRRAAIKVKMDFADQVINYIQMKPELKQRQENLIKKVDVLVAKLERNERSESDE